MRFILLATLIFFTSCKSEKTQVIRHDTDIIKKLKKRSMANCDKKTIFYKDEDGDGYGDNSKTIQACSAPDGYTNISGDCDDSDSRAYPKQTDYFSIPRKNGSFDFDCDGKQTPRLTVRAFCEVSVNKKGCNLASGWDIKGSQKIPDCGVPENWAWNECRAELLDHNTTKDATAVQMAVDPVIPPPSKTVYACWSGKLKWKKRQLCR